MTAALPQDEAAALTAPTATGLSPRAAATLAYAGWWVSGALFLVIEPVHPFVRFHARQALLGLGALWLAGAALWALAFVGVFASVVIFQAAIVGAELIWGAGVLVWAYSSYQAWQSRWWAMPGITSRK
ncbi:MAG: hypothetical protein AB7I50_02755 [Vicinamibacterales bacterium]